MDKIINFYKENKKILYFIFTISLVGLASGIFFYFFISYNDKIKCIKFINKYIENIKNTKYFILFIKSFLFNTILITLIFISGLSLLGLFTGTLLFFTKNFVTGLYMLLLTKTTNYYTASTIYFIPTGIIYILIYSIILLFSLSISGNLIISLFKGKNINFKNITKKYLIIYLIIIGISLILSLYEGLILPKLLLKLI